MAFFTSLASGQVLTGTENNDSFQLSAASAITIVGLAGNDFVRGETAERANWSMGGGSDTLFLSGDLASSTVTLGAGGDSVYVSGSITADTLLKGGDGNDTIGASAVYGATIELGGGADQLEADNILASSTVNFGAGADTLIASSIEGSSEINMGGGADRVVIDFSLSGGSVVSLGAGSDFFVASSISGDSLIQGGGNADTINISSTTDSSQINGGAGADVINVGSGFYYSSTIFGDGGNDTITVGGTLSSGSVNGGAGADIITIESADTGALVVGGQGADVIDFGADLRIGFETATDSNINAIDTLVPSAGGNSATLTFSSVANQDIRIASGIANPSFSTNTEGVVTFNASVGSTLAGRAQLLSDGLGNAEAVLFDADGTRYFFLAGSIKGQIEDDVLVDVGPGFSSLSAATRSVKID